MDPEDSKKCKAAIQLACQGLKERRKAEYIADVDQELLRLRDATSAASGDNAISQGRRFIPQ